MKKTKLLTPLALSAAVFAGGLLSSNTYAEEAGIRIEAQSSNSTCEIYQAGGGSYIHLYDQCDSSLGSYENSVLTLGNLTEDYEIHINAAYLEEPITVKTQNASTTIKNLSSTGRHLVFDLATKELNTTMDISASYYDDDYHHHTGNIEAKSGTINANQGFYADKLTVDGATVTTSSNSISNLEMKSGSLTTNSVISGKTLSVTGGIMTMNNNNVNMSDSVTISGGKINIEKGSLALGSATAFTMSGGELNIDGKSVADSYGIGQPKNGATTSFNFTISGGNINIKNADYGINSRGSLTKLNFNGGTTKIENSSKYAILVDAFADTVKDAIVFGTGMGIKEEGISVFHRDKYNYASSDTGIVAPEVVTITKVDKKDGGDDKSGDKDGEADIKVPDTGAISSKEGGALAVFTVTTFIILSTIAVAGVHKKHVSGHFKYDK